MQVVLDTQGLKLGAGGGIQLAAGTAVTHIDLIHVVHQVHRLLLADVLIQGAAKVVGDVVLAIGEGACAAKTGHNGAALAADAGLDLIAVDGALAFIQCVAGFKNSNLQFRLVLHQLIGSEDAAGASADNNYIIIHMESSQNKQSVLPHKRKVTIS